MGFTVPFLRLVRNLSRLRQIRHKQVESLWFFGLVGPFLGENQQIP